MTGVDLADEDAKFMKYLADNGWEGEVGEDSEKAFADHHAAEAGSTERL